MPVHSYGFQPQQTEDGGRVVNEPPAVDYPAGYSIGPGNDEGGLVPLPGQVVLSSFVD